jgi:hypothetical protein
MRRLPVDTTVLSPICARGPEPVLDYTTKQPAADRDGQALYWVSLLVTTEGEADVIRIKVAGEPKGLATHTPVKVKDLVAQYWRNDSDGRSGVSYFATSIEPARPERAAS